MQLRASSSRRWLGGFVLALALGMAACGDTSNGDQTDEAADSVTQSGGSGESAGGMEGGGEGGSGEGGEGGSGEGVEDGTAEASEAADMADASMSESESAGEASGSASESATTETETGEIPIDCTTVSELECPLVANCVAYVGQPFTSSIDGMTCLGPPQFLGCMFADMACLPATGTLCSGDQVFHVDNLCPLPEGFEPCEPPIDPPPANCG